MDFLLRLQHTLKIAGVRSAVVGGHAVALHGAVRGTLDVDLVIPLEREQYIQAAATLQSMGLSPRLPITAESVFDDRDELIEKKHLIAWSFLNHNNPLELVDILVPQDLNQLETVEIAVGLKQSLVVVGIEDLIKMKRLAGRPQDLADVEALEKLR